MVSLLRGFFYFTLFGINTRRLHVAYHHHHYSAMEVS